MKTSEPGRITRMQDRFRGFLPVIVDVETAGVNPYLNALLEICIVFIDIDEQGQYIRSTSHFEHVLPFEGSILDAESLAFTGIDPYQPLRFAVPEEEALSNLFYEINRALKRTKCQRAVLVGHNAWFDLLFIKEAAKRSRLKSPFHSFTCFDTATLGGFIYGQTVLAKAVECAGISFNQKEAHSAIYDAEKTADLFCAMLNTWHGLIQPTLK